MAIHTLHLKKKYRMYSYTTKGKQMTAITATPKTTLPHLVMAEMEDPSGYRYWSEPISKMELDLWIARQVKLGAGLSDYGCSITCWCAE